MNKQTITIIILSLIILLGILLYGGNYLKDKYTNQGYNSGMFYTVQTGSIPFINQTTNKTEFMPLEDYWQGQCSSYLEKNIGQICSGVQG